MNFDFCDADIQATLGSYSEVVTDGDPVLKSGAGAAFGRAWEASNLSRIEQKLGSHWSKSSDKKIAGGVELLGPS